MKNRKYIVDEKTLRELLTAQLELNFLYSRGVDNWGGYDGFERNEYIREIAEGAFDDVEYDDFVNFSDLAEVKLNDDEFILYDYDD
jgi:hypothetical protein